MIIIEIVHLLTPVVADLMKRYKSRDIISGLLTVAFDLQLAESKSPSIALNHFRALSDTIARARAAKPQ